MCTMVQDQIDIINQTIYSQAFRVYKIWISFPQQTPKDIELFYNQNRKISTPIIIIHCTHNNTIPLNFKQW